LQSGFLRLPSSASMASRTVPNRAYDHHYDPLFTTGSKRGRYRSSRTTASQGSHVEGGQRYKFFRRPLVPFLQSVPAEVMLAKAPQRVPDGRNRSGHAVKHEEPTRTVGVQTVYRDSEAQTESYTPDFILNLKPGEKRPEILSLQGMNQQHGLPAGLIEVEKIEREREKKEFELSLPPMTDEASFMLRKKMMAVQERKEWARREEEIDAVHRERFALIKTALLNREAVKSNLDSQRVESLRQSKLDSKDLFVADVQRRRIKQLRKLSTARQIAEENLYNAKRTRDIIRDYSDFGSNVYAPTQRLGYSVKREQNTEGVLQRSLYSFGGLVELEQTLPAALVSMAVPVPRLLSLRQGGKKRSMNTKQRKANAIRTHLQHTARMLEEEELGGGDTLGDTMGSIAKATGGGATTTAWTKKKQKVVRPRTPVVELRLEDGENGTAHHQALLLLQKLLRGRAVQNMMYEGKERRRELIKELRYEEQLEATKEQHRARNEAEEAERQMQDAIESTRDKMVGEVISSTLNFLANQRGMLLHEAQLSNLADRAESERIRRESKESGTRQAEKRLRARQQEVYRQLLEAHQTAATSYVDEAMDDAVKTAAEQTAMAEICHNAAVVAPITATLEGGQGDEQELMRDLVASFLQPELERQIVEEKVRDSEKHLVDAAHKSVRKAMKS